MKNAPCDERFVVERGITGINSWIAPHNWEGFVLNFGDLSGLDGLQARFAEATVCEPELPGVGAVDGRNPSNRRHDVTTASTKPCGALSNMMPAPLG